MLGKQIKEYLKSNNITQVSLANRIECSPVTLNRFLNGFCDLPIQHRKDLCKALKIDLHSFNDGEIKPASSKSPAVKKVNKARE